jgi:SAM-dependent methyltransferase
MKDAWYATWFDTEDYHLLYEHRDNEEAKVFIDNLVHYLQLPINARVADVACGKGRHCIMLAQHQLDVVGLDLSENSIAYAKQFEEEHLRFYVNDMRHPSSINYYDAVFNFFTSFGYFATELENYKAARAFVAAAKHGGYIVVDFLNVFPIIAKMQQPITKTIERLGTVFEIKKLYEQKKFIKLIDAIKSDGSINHYKEEVQALELKDFEKYFAKFGASLVELFGNYHLDPFDGSTSERMIMIFKKN